MAQSVAALQAQTQAQLIPIISALIRRAHSTRGVILRGAAQEALLLFPTLVLGPQRLGASSFSVKTEVNTSYDLYWRRGDVKELARRAKSLAKNRPTAIVVKHHVQLGEPLVSYARTSLSVRQISPTTLG